MKAPSVLTILIFSILFFFNANLLIAQTNIAKGKIIDAQTKVPIAYAWLVNKELSYYVQSDLDGNFTLYYSNNSTFKLYISFVGYLTDSLLINQSEPNKLFTIKLKPNPFELPVAKVNELSIKSIIKQAIKNIPINYLDSTFYFNATFLQYHFEKKSDEKTNKAVRLIYADVKIQELASLVNSNTSASEKVTVNKLLRSNVYEENKEEHGDHLMDLLEENPVYHTKGTVLNIKALDFFYFSLDTAMGDEEYFKINYESRNSNATKFEKGYLIIDKGTFAIKTYYKEELPNSSLLKRINYVTSVPYRWDFKYGTELVNYESKNGKYILKNMYSQYNHTLVDNKTHSQAYTVSEYFELNVTDAGTHNSIESTKTNYTNFSNLYTLKTFFDNGFYNQLLNWQFFFLTQIEQQLLFNDLSNRATLKSQFVKNCE